MARPKALPATERHVHTNPNLTPNAPPAHAFAATPRPARDRSSQGHKETAATRAQRPLEHSPVSSNLAPEPKLLARVRRRAAKPDAAAYQRQKIFKQLEASGQLPSFVDRGAAFRDAILAEAEKLSDKLVKFLLTEPEVVLTPQGVKLVMPEGARMTDAQVRVLERLLDKFVPQQKPMDLQGKQDTGPRKVSIFVNTVGHKPDYEKLPGGTDGLSVGAAQPTSILKFDAPAQPVIDATPAPPPPEKETP